MRKAQFVILWVQPACSLAYSQPLQRSRAVASAIPSRFLQLAREPPVVDEDNSSQLDSVAVPAPFVSDVLVSQHWLNISEDKLGLLALLTVPVIWGSYVPVVRGLYEVDPPIPGFVFSTAYFAVASVSAFSLLLLEERQGADGGRNKIIPTTRPIQSLLAGAELGTYLFIGNACQVIGLKTVPSDRAGFLVQLTTVLVPLMQATFSGSLASIPPQTWISCCMALLGIAIMTLDDNQIQFVQSDLPSIALNGGDALILCAAFVYSLHVIRLGRWARECKPLTLVAYKATTELLLGLIVMFGLVTFASTNTPVDHSILSLFLRDSGAEIIIFCNEIQDRIKTGTLPMTTIQAFVGATLWTGLVSTAYTTFAQSYGQRRVKPADANLIYSLQPLFTALFAYVILGETLGPFGFGGGMLVGGAAYIVASQSVQSGTKE